MAELRPNGIRTGETAHAFWVVALMMDGKQTTIQDAIVWDLPLCIRFVLVAFSLVNLLSYVIRDGNGNGEMRNKT